MITVAPAVVVSPQMLVAAIPYPCEDHGKSTNVFVASCELDAAFKRVLHASIVYDRVTDEVLYVLAGDSDG